MPLSLSLLISLLLLRRCSKRRACRSEGEKFGKRRFGFVKNLRRNKMFRMNENCIVSCTLMELLSTLFDYDDRKTIKYLFRSDDSTFAVIKLSY